MDFILCIWQHFSEKGSISFKDLPKGVSETKRLQSLFQMICRFLEYLRLRICEWQAQGHSLSSPAYAGSAFGAASEAASWALFGVVGVHLHETNLSQFVGG